MTEIMQWCLDTGWGLLTYLGKILLIVIPLMVAVEFLKHYHLIEKLNRPFRPLMHFIGLPPQAAYMMLTGLILGIVYGGGMIIDAAQDGSLTPKQVKMACLFLCICHSLVEDHILVMSIGAHGILLAILRLLIASLTLIIMNKVMKDEPTQNLAAQS